VSYGCYSRPPFADSYTMHGISKDTGDKAQTIIPFRGSPDCNYTSTDLGQADAGCVGCRHKQVTKEAAWHD